MSSSCKCINISIYPIFNYQSFNDTLTKDIVKFEQQNPDRSGVGCSLCDLMVALCGIFSCFVMFVVSMLRLVDLV